MTELIKALEKAEPFFDEYMKGWSHDSPIFGMVEYMEPATQRASAFGSDTRREIMIGYRAGKEAMREELGNYEGMFQTFANINDTCRSRGFDAGPSGTSTQDRVIGLAQAYDAMRERVEALESQVDALAAALRHIESAKPLFAYVANSNLDGTPKWDLPGSPYDRGVKAAYDCLSAIARSALSMAQPAPNEPEAMQQWSGPDSGGVLVGEDGNACPTNGKILCTITDPNHLHTFRRRVTNREDK